MRTSEGGYGEWQSRFTATLPVCAGGDVQEGALNGGSGGASWKSEEVGGWSGGLSGVSCGAACSACDCCEHSAVCCAVDEVCDATTDEPSADSAARGGAAKLESTLSSGAHRNLEETTANHSNNV